MIWCGKKMVIAPSLVSGKDNLNRVKDPRLFFPAFVSPMPLWLYPWEKKVVVIAPLQR